jgi:ribonuclease P protein component
MEPPVADVVRQSAKPADASAVDCFGKPQTLKQRADFLKAAKAKRVPCTAFLLQARQRPLTEGSGLRVGFTCSKKIGNAVARNRAKRRLRALARGVMPKYGQEGWDYVLVGRPNATTTHDFAAMCAELERALKKLHGGAQ